MTPLPPFVFRGRRLDRDRPAVMAIISPSAHPPFDREAERAARAEIEQVLIEGADLIDVEGGYPGRVRSADANTAEEIQRVLPLIEWAREQWPSLIISVNTGHAQVGRLACQAGADIVYDRSAGADAELVEVAAEFGAGYVCSHAARRAPRESARQADVVADVIAATTAAAERAVAVGVPREGLLIDPTFDTTKSTGQSLNLMKHLDLVVATGWPVLAALSGNDFIAATLDVPAEKAMAGTIAATTIAAVAGAAMFRVHNVLVTHHTLEIMATARGT